MSLNWLVGGGRGHVFMVVRPRHCRAGADVSIGMGIYAIKRGITRRSETIPVKFCDRIEINPAVCHGKPVVRGTRIMVSQVLGALSGGDSIEDVLMDYPSLSPEDVFAVFAFAGTLASFEDIPYDNASVAL